MSINESIYITQSKDQFLRQIMNLNEWNFCKQQLLLAWFTGIARQYNSAQNYNSKHYMSWRPDVNSDKSIETTFGINCFRLTEHTYGTFTIICSTAVDHTLRIKNCSINVT